jgi:hypothetical protein
VVVIVLDKPVRGPTAEIAPLRLLDEMKAAGTLTQSTQFTSVGYGAQEDEPPHGWGLPGSTFTYLDTREYAIGYFNALGKGYLKISQNVNAGSGGTCYGDSGGPQFLGGPESNLQVSVTVTGRHGLQVDERRAAVGHPRGPVLALAVRRSRLAARRRWRLFRRSSLRESR